MDKKLFLSSELGLSYRLIRSLDVIGPVFQPDIGHVALAVPQGNK
jgi:hypothetical protein